MPDENVTPVATENATPEAKVETPAPAADWRESFGEFKSAAEFEKFKTPQDFAKSHLELVKMIGKDKVVLPNEKSKPEEIKAFYQKLGVPETPQGYKIPQIEGVTLNKEGAEAFLKVAHESNLSQKQIDSLYKYVLDSGVASAKDREAAEIKKSEEAVATLRGEFGRAYDERLGAANKVLANFATPDELKAIQGTLGNDPNMVRFLSKIGAAMSESGFKGMGAGPSVMTPDMAKNEIHRIMSDPHHPINVKNHPEHNVAVERMLDLQRMTSN